MSSTEIERKSLEAHVDLCAERYKNLDEKLENLEKRIDKVEEHLVDIKDTIISKMNKNTDNSNVDSYKTIITIGTSIFGILLTAVLGILVHLATK